MPVPVPVPIFVTEASVHVGDVTGVVLNTTLALPQPELGTLLGLLGIVREAMSSPEGRCSVAEVAAVVEKKLDVRVTPTYLQLPRALSPGDGPPLRLALPPPALNASQLICALLDVLRSAQPEALLRALEPDPQRRTLAQPAPLSLGGLFEVPVAEGARLALTSPGELGRADEWGAGGPPAWTLATGVLEEWADAPPGALLLLAELGSAGVELELRVLAHFWDVRVYAAARGQPLPGLAPGDGAPPPVAFDVWARLAVGGGGPLEPLRFEGAGWLDVVGM